MLRFSWRQRLATEAETSLCPSVGRTLPQYHAQTCSSVTSWFRCSVCRSSVQWDEFVIIGLWMFCPIFSNSFSRCFASPPLPSRHAASATCDLLSLTQEPRGEQSLLMNRSVAHRLNKNRLERPVYVYKHKVRLFSSLGPPGRSQRAATFTKVPSCNK